MIYVSPNGFAAVQFVDPETFEERVERIELVDDKWTAAEPGMIPASVLKELNEMKYVMIGELPDET